jgi:RNA polymerase sigma-70 factor (ECF subfamily)
MGTMRGVGGYEEDAVVRSGARRNARADEGGLGLAVARARGGDETAFGAVYREAQPMLLGYARGLVGDDAEDVVAGAWHEIIRDLGTFRGDGAGFRVWAATVARRHALDHIGRTGARPRGTAPDRAETRPAPDPAVLPVECLSAADALAVIAALPPDQGEAVLLRVVLGLSGPEAAEVLGAPPDAVRAAAHRGLRRLADRLTGPHRPAGDPGEE